jgi:hypothetical protein
MADRYWVGGTAAWDTTIGTKWSATSGGAGGASIPTASDDVYFDANSGSGTVTVTGTRPCLSLNTTGFTGTLAGASTPILQINASLTLGSGTTIAGTLTNVNFVGTTATRTLTSNGVSLINVTVAMTSTNVLTLQDNFTVTTNFTFTTGVLELGSNTLQTAIFTNTSTSTRTLNFGTGKLVLTGSGTVFNGVVSGFSTSGTTKIVEPSLGAAQTITPGALSEANSFDISVPATAGNFTLTLTAGGYHDLSFANATYTVANTAISVYGNLLISDTSPTFTAGTSAWTFASASATQTVNSGGKTLDFPIVINGANTTVQLQDALTVASGRTVTLTDGTLDLQSYTLSTGLFSSANSNTRTIAFGTGKIVLTGTGTVWNTSTVTNLVTSGSKVVEPALGAAQTITPGAITEADAFDVSVPATAGNFALTLTAGNFRNLTFANATYTVVNTSITIFGNVVVGGTSPTFSAGTGVWTFSATGSAIQDFTSNGATFNFSMTKGATTSTFRIQDAFSLIGVRTFTFNQGTLELQSYTFTTPIFSSSVTNARTISFSTGKIVLRTTASSVTAWNSSTATNFTSSGTKLVEIEPPSTSITNTYAFGAVTEANTLDVSVVSAGSGNISMSGNINNLTLGNFSYNFNSNTISIFGNFLVSGTSPNISSANAITFAATSGTKTITTNGDLIDTPITINGVGGTFQLQDALTLGTTRTFTFTAGTLDLQSYTLTTGIFNSNNSNTRTLNFGTGKIVVDFTTSGATTVFNMVTSTNFVSTGSRLIEALTRSITGARTYSFGTGVTEANTLNLSFVLGASSGGEFIITGRINNFNADNVSFSINRVSSSFSVYGNFTLGGTSPGWTGNYTAGTTITFASTSTGKTITCNGGTIGQDISFNGVGGSWILQDACNVSSIALSSLVAGTLDLNSYTFTSGRFNPSGTTARTLTYGTNGEIVLNDSGNNQTLLSITNRTNLTLPDKYIFNLSPTGSGSIATVTSGSESVSPDLIVNSFITFNLATSGEFHVRHLTINGFGGVSVNSTNSNIIIYGDFITSSTAQVQGFNSGGILYNPELRFNSTSATVRVISTNGASIRSRIDFRTAGSWRFDSNFTHEQQIDANNNVNSILHSAGTVNLNGYTITTNRFATGSGTRTLNFDNSLLVILGYDTPYPSTSGSNSPLELYTTNLTLTGNDTGEIRFTSGAPKGMYAGGGVTDPAIPKIRSLGGSRLLINNLSTRITIFDLLPDTASTSIYEFPSFQTTYFSNFTLTPPVGRTATIRTKDSATNVHFLVLNSGIADCQRLYIEYSNATPATNTWYAGSTSTNGGNNTGWIFANAPKASGNMLMLFI